MRGGQFPFSFFLGQNSRNEEPGARLFGVNPKFFQIIVPQRPPDHVEGRLDDHQNRSGGHAPGQAGDAPPKRSPNGSVAGLRRLNHAIPTVTRKVRHGQDRFPPDPGPHTPSQRRAQDESFDPKAETPAKDVGRYEFVFSREKENHVRRVIQGVQRRPNGEFDTLPRPAKINDLSGTVGGAAARFIVPSPGNAALALVVIPDQLRSPEKKDATLPGIFLFRHPARGKHSFRVGGPPVRETGSPFESRQEANG